MAQQELLSKSNTTMAAIIATSFGSAQDVLKRVDDQPKPQLKDAKAKGAKHLLVRVQACSLSPGDYRMLSGDGKLIKKPKGGFPYVPGGDVCGVVEAIGSSVSDFAVGDTVVGTWAVFGQGGLAAHTLVDSALAVHKSKALSSLQAAAAANSAGQALQALKASTVVSGDRVLVLGGSGGVGTCLTQMLKHAGASFVAATTTKGKVLDGLGVDRYIDYTRENWWELEEFVERPFNVIIDCAVGVKAWRTALTAKTTSGKSVFSATGRWLAVVLNDWHITAKQPWHMASILGPPLARQLRNTLQPNGRRYKMFLGGVDGKVLQEVMQMVDEGKLKIVMDPKGPFPFTEQGVKDAFALHESRHAMGKVVTQVSD